MVESFSIKKQRLITMNGSGAQVKSLSFVRDSEREILTKYFNLACELVENGKFYCFADERHVFPVPRFKQGPHGQLSMDEDFLVEVLLPDDLLAGRSVEEIYRGLEGLKRQFSSGVIPDKIDHRVVNKRDIERSHDWLGPAAPYTYIHKDARNRDRHIRILECTDELKWPTPSFPVCVKKGDILSIARPDLDYLKDLLRDSMDRMRREETPAETIIRQNLFHMGHPLSTKAKIQPMSHEELSAYQPVL